MADGGFNLTDEDIILFGMAAIFLIACGRIIYVFIKQEIKWRRDDKSQK